MEIRIRNEEAKEIAHVSVSTTPPGDAKVIGLAPVAVCLDVQSQGIGLKKK